MDDRDIEDGPLVPVQRSAAYLRPAIESVDLETGDLGMRYVKIVKRPSDGRPILDVMFQKGLRLTVDIDEGMETSDVVKSLRSQAAEYRPASWQEMDDALTAVSRLAEKTFGGSDGKVVPFRFESELRAEREAELRHRWAESMFFLHLKKSGVAGRHPYELAMEALREHYASTCSTLPPSP